MTKQQEKDRIDIIGESKEKLGKGPPSEGFKLIGRIRRINALYVQKMNKIFQQKFGSNCGEYDVLGTISWSTSEDGCVTPGQLADTILLSSPAMTNRVNRLEAKGLIYRDRDITDRRLVLLGLTPEGRKMAREMDAIYNQFFIQHFKQLKIKEKDDLANLLRKMVFCFEEDRKK